MNISFCHRLLGEIVVDVASWNPVRDGQDRLIRYIDLSSVNQDTKVIEPNEPIVAREAPSRARQLVQTGDVLVSTVRPNLNGVARVPETLDGSTASTGFCVLRPKDSELDGGYLFHWVKAPMFVADMVRKATGASYPAVSDRIVMESLIPLPPLVEQRRIAAILDQAQALRANRRRALAQLDNLIQSLFLDLFGHPIQNEKGWPIGELGSVARVERGKFTPRPRNDPTYYDGPFPFIQTGDISSSEGRLKLWSQTLNEKGIAVSRSFPPRTVVIAIVGATLGITAILDIEVYCPDSVIGIQVHSDKASSEYIERVLRFWRPIFVAQAPETARANINLETLRPLRIPLPPLSLQREFAAQVSAVERLKASQRASLAKLDALFTSLQHRAFRGEL
jgi:type I restriction enzyme, S subunit